VVGQLNRPGNIGMWGDPGGAVKLPVICRLCCLAGSVANLERDFRHIKADDPDLRPLGIMWPQLVTQRWGGSRRFPFNRRRSVAA
jgi:hypothetical protein